MGGLNRLWQLAIAIYCFHHSELHNLNIADCHFSENRSGPNLTSTPMIPRGATVDMPRQEGRDGKLYLSVL